MTQEHLGKNWRLSQWLTRILFCVFLWHLWVSSSLFSVVLPKSSSHRVFLLNLDTDTTLWFHCKKHSQAHTHTKKETECVTDFNHGICSWTLFLCVYCYQLPLDITFVDISPRFWCKTPLRLYHCYQMPCFNSTTKELAYFQSVLWDQFKSRHSLVRHDVRHAYTCPVPVPYTLTLTICVLTFPLIIPHLTQTVSLSFNHPPTELQ